MMNASTVQGIQAHMACSLKLSKCTSPTCWLASQCVDPNLAAYALRLNSQLQQNKLESVQIPEHTWGFDTKTFLHDSDNWSNKDFHAQLDAHAQNYEDNIAQWQRQRGYMTWAVEALDQSLAPLAQTPDTSLGGVIADVARADLLTGVKAEWRQQHELTDLEGYEEHPVGEPLTLKSQYWQIEVNTTTGNAAAPKGNNAKGNNEPFLSRCAQQRIFCFQVLLHHAITGSAAATPTAGCCCFNMMPQ